MSDPPQYQQVLGTSLFVLPSGSTDVGWAAYLVVRGDTPPKQPISVRDGLAKYNGHFLFALTAPSLTTVPEVQKVVEGVYKWLDQSFGPPQPAFSGSALVWITDPTVPSFAEPGACAFTIEAISASSWIVDSDFNNTIGRRLTASMPTGSSIAVSDEETALVFAGSGIGLSTTDPGHAPTVSPAQATLPVVGPYRGCLLFTGQVTPSVTFDYFETGVRFTHPSETGVSAQTYPVLSSASSNPVAYTASLDPLDPTNASRVTVDRVGGRMRSLFALLPDGNQPVFLDAWLRTATGLATALTPRGGAAADGSPQPGSGALVLERTGEAADENSQVYLTLAGDWGIAVPGGEGKGTGPDGTYELLCGVNGLERIAFRAYEKEGSFDRLRFVPGSPGFAARFPFPKASIGSLASTGDLLDDSYGTAWMTVHSPDTRKVTYLAQPASAPLYEVAEEAEDGASTIFNWMPTSTALPQQAGFAVPIAPYAGLQVASSRFPGDELSLFETQVLAPTRKRAVSPASRAQLQAARLARAAPPVRRRRTGSAFAPTPLTPPPPSATATTPQGFLVTLLDQLYGTVTLARSAGRDLALENVTTQMQDLLQTNQLFAVLVDPRYVGAPSPAPKSQATLPAFADTVTMSQWELSVPVGAGSTVTDYHNVLILKFVDGTLEERVSAPQKWTDVRDFSLLPVSGVPDDVRLSGLSQWLRQFIDAALQEADAGNPLYADFATLARDSSWNGFLALKTDIVSLPPQLEGLMAGIDKTQLNAHHFGATVTPVTASTSGAQLGLSSLFGLIDYQLPQYRQSVASGASPDTPLGLSIQGSYGFSVLQLQALFRNAALADFHSRIQLTANELFGSRTTGAYGAIGKVPATGVVLSGSYQSQGGKDAYVFEQDATTVFTLADGVLRAVAVTRAQFDTLGQTGSGATATTQSRFLMWGALDFAELQDSSSALFDLLSFGSPGDTAPAKLGTGLSFSNLKLDMSFATATPQETSFAFDAATLAFDLATSAPRPDSMFDSLQLQLDSFLAAPSGKRLPDYGYLNVGSSLNLAAVDGQWYGVVYKLTLGSPGALVAKAGFESRLIVGWAPGPALPGASGQAPTYSVVSGILLPGTAPGAKTLSLQGVLKVSVGAIQLLRQEVQGHTGQQAFVLQLRNVGLSFLGVAKLPPGATIDFFLFGALQAGGSLGWYAAYRKDAKSQALAAIDSVAQVERLP